MPEIKDVTNAHLALIPKYDGSPNSLNSYIEGCEYLITILSDRQNINNPVNSYLLQLFKSRLTGNAQDLINSARSCQNWPDLKQLLQSQFCDQRSEICLAADIQNSYPQSNETPYNFGIRLKNLRNLLFAKLKITENDEANRNTKISIYNSTVLQVFLRGLEIMGDIGFRVRTRNPASVEAAMNLVVEEENFRYYTKKVSYFGKPQYKAQAYHLPTRPQTVPQQSHKPFQSAPNRIRMANPISMPTPSRLPVASPQFRPMVTSNQNTQYSPNRPYMQPNQFTANRRYYQGPSSFQFAKTPGQLEQKRQPRQTPMDTSTVQQSNNQRSNPFFRPTGKPNWVSEELHHQQCAEPMYENVVQNTTPPANDYYEPYSSEVYQTQSEHECEEYSHNDVLNGYSENQLEVSNSEYDDAVNFQIPASDITNQN